MVVGALLVSLCGCSRDGPPLLSGASERLPPPPSEAERARWRTIGVTMSAAAPVTGLDTWIRGDRGEGAVRGMVEGFFVGGVAGAYGGGFGVLIGAPVGLVIGGAGGAGNAVPDATAEEIDAFVTEHFDGQRLGATLRDRVATAAGRETGLPITVLEPAPARTGPAGCAEASAASTLVELTLTGYGFTGGGADPVLGVVLGVQGRIVDVDSCEERHAVPLTYVGAQRKYSAWRTDAAALQDEIVRGLSALAERLVEELFLLYLPEGKARGETTDRVAGRGDATPRG